MGEKVNFNSEIEQKILSCYNRADERRKEHLEKGYLWGIGYCLGIQDSTVFLLNELGIKIKGINE